MPDDRTTSFPVLPDGSRVVIPIRSGTSATSQRVEIQGVMRCAYNNQAYDALYACNSSGAGDPARAHAYLSWQPRPPQLEEADVQAHRYVFRFPAMAAGVSPTVRVDIDRFVNAFLIPPSEVRGSLSGQFNISVRSAAVAEAAPWPLALAAVPALAIAGGLAWVIGRRMSAVTLDFDLEAQLARILAKSNATRNAASRADARLVPVRARLKALESGASRLAGQIQQIRGACKLHSRFALERDIAALETQAAPNSAVPEDILLTMADKRKALASLTDLEKSETAFSARLNRVEAILESALAGLQTVKTGAMAAPVSDSVCRSLDAEVSALREAARPLPETILLGGVERR